MQCTVHQTEISAQCQTYETCNTYTLDGWSHIYVSTQVSLARPVTTFRQVSLKTVALESSCSGKSRAGKRSDRRILKSTKVWHCGSTAAWSIQHYKHLHTMQALKVRWITSALRWSCLSSYNSEFGYCAGIFMCVFSRNAASHKSLYTTLRLLFITR